MAEVRLHERTQEALQDQKEDGRKAREQEKPSLPDGKEFLEVGISLAEARRRKSSLFEKLQKEGAAGEEREAIVEEYNRANREVKEYYDRFSSMREAIAANPHSFPYKGGWLVLEADPQGNGGKGIVTVAGVYRARKEVDMGVRTGQAFTKDLSNAPQELREKVYEEGLYLLNFDGTPDIESGVYDKIPDTA